MDIPINTDKLLKSNMSFMFDSKVKFNSQYFMFITSDGLATGLNLILKKAKTLKHQHPKVPLENIIHSCLKDIENLCNEDFNSEVQRILKENKISEETYYFLLINILYEIAIDLSDSDDYKKMVLSILEQINISNFIRLCYNKLSTQIISTKNYDFLININDKGTKNFYLSYVNQIINKSIYAALYEIINFDQLLNISKQYKEINVHKMIQIHNNIIEIKETLNNELNNIKELIAESNETLKTELNEQIKSNIEGLYYNDKQIGEFLSGIYKQIGRLKDKIDNLYAEEEEEKSLNIQIQPQDLNQNNIYNQNEEEQEEENQEENQEIKEEKEQSYSLPKAETFNIKINRINDLISDNEEEKEEQKISVSEEELKKIDNEMNKETLKNIIEQNLNKNILLEQNKSSKPEHGVETLDNMFSKL